MIADFHAGDIRTDFNDLGGNFMPQRRECFQIAQKMQIGAAYAACQHADAHHMSGHGHVRPIAKLDHESFFAIKTFHGWNPPYSVISKV